MTEIKIAIIKNGVTPSYQKFEGDNYGPVGWCSRVALGLEDTNDDQVGSLTACIFPRPEDPAFSPHIHGYNGASGQASEWVVIGLTMNELRLLKDGFQTDKYAFVWNDMFAESNADSMEAIEQLLKHGDGKIGE